MALPKTKTPKVKGVIAKKEVIVLNDIGEKNNFILVELVKELKLLRSETSEYDIILGIGDAVRGSEYARMWC